MVHDFHQRVKTIFMEALELEPARRHHLLRERCAGDSALRSEVESLLSFHETETGILDAAPNFDALNLPAPPPRSGQQPGHSLVGSEIGSYHLKEFLGEGGMGLVFLAEQREPVQRKVALKILKSDSETAEILARFEAERQVLTLMDHPCIARIHEAGATEQGRPFFTMELVQGIPLHEFCDRNRLTIRQRLDLFLQVCEGIQHAHQKGIIHRDLKPSNLLVAGTGQQPRPKIIDFGVAKTRFRDTVNTPPVTVHGHLVGTPDYMSPEQAASAGKDVDTRSDIYSLGAILYELLCGVLPLETGDPNHGGLATVQQRILKTNPARPSQRIAQLPEAKSVAQSRRTRPGRLARQFRLDLDWIVLTALAKDREQRYATVSELRADVTRYLRGEPIQAGPPNLGYRFQKYVRKNLIPLAASAAVILALTGGLVASLNFARKSEMARLAAAEMTVLAQREAKNAETASEYLGSILMLASPILGGDPEMKLMDAVALISKRMDERLTDAPEVNADTHLIIADVHLSLGSYERAESHARQALQILRELPDPDPEQLAAALEKYARLLMELSKPAAAEPVYREALDLYRELANDQNPDRHPKVISILTNLVTIVSLTGSKREAADAYRELIAYQELEGDGNRAAVGRSLMLLGYFLAIDARYDEGERHLKRALAIFEDELGERDRFVLFTKTYLAILYRLQGNFEAAQPLLVAAADTFQTQLGAENPYLLRVQRELATTLAGLGRYTEAESLFALTLNMEGQGEDGPNQAVATTRLFQGDMFRMRGESARALACYRDVYRIANEVSPDSDHFLKAMAQHQLALDDAARGNLVSARDRLEDCLAQRRKSLRTTHPRVIQAIADLTRVLLRTAAFAEAQPLVTEYFVTARQEYGSDHAETRLAAELNQEFYQATGAVDLANRWRGWLAGTTESPPLSVVTH